MIQEQITEDRKPGKNAIDHACEMQVEAPDEEGQLIKCRILAKIQCSTCTAWICGTEELEHSIVCVRCDTVFCAECYHDHRVENKCQEAA